MSSYIRTQSSFFAAFQILNLLNLQSMPPTNVLSRVGVRGERCASLLLSPWCRGIPCGILSTYCLLKSVWSHWMYPSVSGLWQLTSFPFCSCFGVCASGFHIFCFQLCFIVLLPLGFYSCHIFQLDCTLLGLRHSCFFFFTYQLLYRTPVKSQVAIVYG